MGRTTSAVLLMAALAMGAPGVPAQEKPGQDVATDARQLETTPLRISVTFTEFEGDKKVKSLPYTMVVVADGRPPKSILRWGVASPFTPAKKMGCSISTSERSRVPSSPREGQPVRHSPGSR